MAAKMRPFRETIPLEEARRRIDGALRPLDRTERVPLAEASGRILARDVVAGTDVPPFARAAMDGYAVRAADTAGATPQHPVVLNCIEQVFTGQIPSRVVHAGACIEVATGAPMPGGADAVVIVEDTESDVSASVRVGASVRPGQHVGARGADIPAGSRVLRDGDALNASRVGALAALGVADVEVYARPRVAILSTGNEIVDPGDVLAPGQIYDVNRFTLAAVVAEHGGVPVVYRTASDTLDDLTRAVGDCLAEDVLVFSGGSSVGERDLTLDVMRARGTVLFHGISLKPGKPTAFGLVEGKPVFGMPGYPASCLTNAHLLLAPALRRIARLPRQRPRLITLPTAAPISSVSGRHQILTVRIDEGSVVQAFKASGDITSLSQADGYIEIPADVVRIEPGTLVEVALF